DQIDALGADPVAERTRAEQEGGEDQRVGVDYPLQPSGVRAQRLAQARQGYVDDGDVELDQGEAEARHNDGAPDALVRHDRRTPILSRKARPASVTSPLSGDSWIIPLSARLSAMATPSLPARWS